MIFEIRVINMIFKSHKSHLRVASKRGRAEVLIHSSHKVALMREKRTSLKISFSNRESYQS